MQEASICVLDSKEGIHRNERLRVNTGRTSSVFVLSFEDAEVKKGVEIVGKQANLGRCDLPEINERVVITGYTRCNLDDWCNPIV